MMATKKQFVQRCERLGVTYEIDRTGESANITIDAPQGYCFRASGAHCCCAGADEDDEGRRIPMSAVYDQMIEDMDAGLWECEDPECDICHP